MSKLSEKCTGDGCCTMHDSCRLLPCYHTGFPTTVETSTCVIILTRLRERLEGAERSMKTLAGKEGLHADEYLAKAQGINLALQYVHDEMEYWGV